MSARAGATVEEPPRLGALLAVEFNGSSGVAAGPKDLFDLATAAAPVFREMTEIRRVPLDRRHLHGSTMRRARAVVKWTTINL
jgi:hypothetical protein